MLLHFLLAGLLCSSYSVFILRLRLSGITDECGVCRSEPIIIFLALTFVDCEQEKLYEWVTLHFGDVHSIPKHELLAFLQQQGQVCVTSAALLAIFLVLLGVSQDIEFRCCAIQAAGFDNSAFGGQDMSFQQGMGKLCSIQIIVEFYENSLYVCSALVHAANFYGCLLL